MSQQQQMKSIKSGCFLIVSHQFQILYCICKYMIAFDSYNHTTFYQCIKKGSTISSHYSVTRFIMSWQTCCSNSCLFHRWYLAIMAWTMKSNMVSPWWFSMLDFTGHLNAQKMCAEIDIGLKWTKLWHVLLSYSSAPVTSLYKLSALTIWCHSVWKYFC